LIFPSWTIWRLSSRLIDAADIFFAAGVVIWVKKAFFDGAHVWNRGSHIADSEAQG
jgi:hypothetical protein